jgi:hypothetical protein
LTPKIREALKLLLALGLHFGDVMQIVADCASTAADEAHNDGGED